MPLLKDCQHWPQISGLCILQVQLVAKLCGQQAARVEEMALE